jgi:hypothetical protein
MRGPPNGPIAGGLRRSPGHRAIANKEMGLPQQPHVCFAASAASSLCLYAAFRTGTCISVT